MRSCFVEFQYMRRVALVICESYVYLLVITGDTESSGFLAKVVCLSVGSTTFLKTVQEITIVVLARYGDVFLKRHNLDSCLINN